MKFKFSLKNTIHKSLKNAKKFYQILFFGIFTQNYWRKLSQINLRMAIMGGFAWIFCSLSIFFILKYNTTNDKIFSFLFGFFSIFSTIIWLKNRKRGLQYYEEFQVHVQNFLQKNQKNNISSNHKFYAPKITKNILKNYTFLGSYHVISMQILAILSGFLFIILQKEYARINAQKPQTLTQVIKNKIKNTNILLKNIDKKQKEIGEKLQNTEVNIKVLEKTLKEGQQSHQQQQGAIWQNYAFLGILNQTHQQLNKVISIPEKEEILKNNPIIFAQVLGLVEVELDMADKNTAQASEMLSQGGTILGKFQKFSSYQQNCQYKAQKGVELDQKRIKELQTQLTQQKNILNYLKNQQKTDSLRFSTYQKDVVALENQMKKYN